MLAAVVEHGATVSESCLFLSELAVPSHQMSAMATSRPVDCFRSSIYCNRFFEKPRLFAGDVAEGGQAPRICMISSAILTVLCILRVNSGT